jgi:hypothetical protein
MAFLDIEDIRALRLPIDAPKTETQKDREQLEEVIRADELSK